MSNTDARPRRDPLRLTKTVIANLVSTNASHPQIFWDRDLRGFGVLVSGKSRKKSYVVQHGRIPRRTIGDCSIITVDEARRIAVQVLGKLHQGIDPREEKRTAKLRLQAEALSASKRDVTLQQVLESFGVARKDIRASTLDGYRWLLAKHCSDWVNLPLHLLTREMVETRHRRICDEVKRRGRNKLVSGCYSANATMRVVRALWNYAIAGELVSDLGANPVTVLSRVRAWYPEARRDRILSSDYLPQFYSAVLSLENDAQRDLILLMLFTGLRVSEASRLRWSEVDMPLLMIRLPASRTKAGRRLDLPLSDCAAELMASRRKYVLGDYVFPGKAQDGHISEIRPALRRVAAQTREICITPHDLRRTFITTGEACEISVYALKRLVNHSTGSDVTGGYVQLTDARLRDAAQLIANRLKAQIGIFDVEPVRATA